MIPESAAINSNEANDKEGDNEAAGQNNRNNPNEGSEVVGIDTVEEMARRQKKFVNRDELVDTHLVAN